MLKELKKAIQSNLQALFKEEKSHIEYNYEEYMKDKIATQDEVNGYKYSITIDPTTSYTSFPTTTPYTVSPLSGSSISPGQLAIGGNGTIYMGTGGAIGGSGGTGSISTNYINYSVLYVKNYKFDIVNAEQFLRDGNLGLICNDGVLASYEDYYKIIIEEIKDKLDKDAEEAKNSLTNPVESRLNILRSRTFGKSSGMWTPLGAIQNGNLSPMDLFNTHYSSFPKIFVSFETGESLIVNVNTMLDYESSIIYLKALCERFLYLKDLMKDIEQEDENLGVLEKTFSSNTLGNQINELMNLEIQSIDLERNFRKRVQDIKEGKKEKQLAFSNDDCPEGFTCVNGECVPVEYPTSSYELVALDISDFDTSNI